MNFLKRLFGSSAPPARAETTESPRLSTVTAATAPSKQGRDAIDGYYATMAKVQGAMSRRDFDAAAQAVRENLKFMHGWAVATKGEYGSFDISSIPGIEKGGIALALVGDDVGLAEMRAVVAGNPDLAPWAEGVAQASEDRRLFERILNAVAASPSCLQTDLKELLGEQDGTRVAFLLGHLEKAGRVARVKVGKTYKLLLPDSEDFPVPAPKRAVSSHRTDSSPPRLREIDISKLEYVPLPRSPLKWEKAQAGRERAKIPEAIEPFEVRDAEWTFSAIERIPPAERPDTAYRQTHPSAAGIILIDDLGKAEGIASGPSSAIRYDRSGRVASKAALLHDVYRVGVHPLGHGVIAISREAVLHSYDDELKPVIETDLTRAPEIIAIRKRFEIADGELKNHIRCIAQSRDASRYLFTVVDEAWCVSSGGAGLWGAKMPLKEGWTRVAATSGGFGTSADVEQALKLMDLSLPVTPEDLKGRYRTLAKQWHPDLNPGDPKAGERMGALSAALEVLTGIDASSLPQYTGTRFTQELSQRTIKVGDHSITAAVSMQVSERFASDWIYAASFAADAGAVYLAGYSGRVVLVDQNGGGVRVYDIGTVPRQIVDTGTYLYILTHTRLYVLRDAELHALIDTFDGGEVVVAQNGFGVLDKKRLRWFEANGTYAGSIITKDPIRRLYFDEEQMIVETRQSRAKVTGVTDRWSPAVA